MNEERASYALGYRAVGTISQIDPAYDLGMALFHKEPKRSILFPSLMRYGFGKTEKRGSTDTSTGASKLAADRLRQLKRYTAAIIYSTSDLRL